jgi:hypothetical protein
MKRAVIATLMSTCFMARRLLRRGRASGLRARMALPTPTRRATDLATP